MTDRRIFIKKSLLVTGALASGIHNLFSNSSSDLKISKVYHYKPPNYHKQTFNQARDIVVIETDSGLTGIGEGGSEEMIKQCAELLIGEDPFRIDYLWQKMYRGYFYPAGREKLHALGALDVALWDLKSKALGVPLYDLIGGKTREYIPCYASGFPYRGTASEVAAAAIDAGFFAYRGAKEFSEDGVFSPHQTIRKMYDLCKEIREGVGPEGNWMIDLHTRYNISDATAICRLLEPLEPFFVEDIVRSENINTYEVVRNKVNVPIAVGEQFGDKWDVNDLIEKHLIDYSRVTIANCGGITEFLKISGICETHYVGLTPHFTGPIATAAVVQALTVFSGPVVYEMRQGKKEEIDYLNSDYINFKNGKIYQNGRPGIGIELDKDKLDLIRVITKPGPKHPMYHRPDGSLTNW